MTNKMRLKKHVNNPIITKEKEEANFSALRRIFILFVSVMILGFQANAIERFKPTVTLFENFHQGFGRENDVTKYEHRRGYLGLKYKDDGPWSAQIIFDISAAYVDEDERLVFNADLKNASVTWKDYGFDVSAGIIKTNNFGLKEDAWGYRYIEASFEDVYRFAPSADLGISVGYKFTDRLKADFTFTNGKGHEVLKITDNFRYGFGATYTFPQQGLTLRAYYDYYTKENSGKSQHSTSLFLGYKNARFSLSGEYNYQFNRRFIAGADAGGLSVYSTVNLYKDFKYFARYDLKQSTDMDVFEAGNMIRTGIEYKPIKYISIAPNILADQVKGGKFATYFYLNLLVKF